MVYMCHIFFIQAIIDVFSPSFLYESCKRGEEQSCMSVNRYLCKQTPLFLPSFNRLSSQHSRASCSVSMQLCGSELVSEFWVLTWFHCGLRDCYDFHSFAFAKEWFTSNYVVNFRVGAMWCWEECIFCVFGVKSSVNVYQVCLFQVWVQVLDILVNFLSAWSV